VGGRGLAPWVGADAEYPGRAGAPFLPDRAVAKVVSTLGAGKGVNEGMSTPTIAAGAAPRVRYRALLFGAVAVATLSLSVIAAAAAPSGPAPTSSGHPPAAARPAAAGQVSAVLDGDCDNYGYDVTNHDTAPHTVTMTVGGTAGAPVVLDPGQTKHLALDPNVEPATEVKITDSDGTVIADGVTRFCTTTTNRDVTINANTTYTLTGEAPRVVDPKPQHGTAVVVGKGPQDIRYTPDPCFAGTDRFGYDDFVLADQGTVTVHVKPGACKVTVRRTATDCAKRRVIESATNPYSLPVTVVVQGPSGPSDTETALVPAHSTRVVLFVTYLPTDAVADKYLFIVEGIDDLPVITLDETI